MMFDWSSVSILTAALAGVRRKQFLVDQLIEDPKHAMIGYGQLLGLRAHGLVAAEDRGSKF